MRRRTTSSWMLGVALTAGFALPSAADPGPGDARTRPIVAVVPFVNVSGQPDAVAKVMSEVWAQLEAKGFVLEKDGRIESFLRTHRIRARNALSRAEALALARKVGARYLLMGSIDTWTVNGGPEVGLTSRIMDPQGGRVIWVGEASLHAVPEAGLLAMARPRTLEAATRRAVRKLFSTLSLRAADGELLPGKKRRRPKRSLLAQRPISFRSEALKQKDHLTIAVMPLINRSRHPEATAVVGDHLLAWLLSATKIRVVDPGELRRALIELRIQPLHGLNCQQLHELGEALEIDALLDGTILVYENKTAAKPSIDLHVRLRDTESGEVLWSATTFRHGEQARTLYDMGRIRGIERLAEAALSDVLSTWFR